MGLTCSQLTDEVQALTGPVDDTVLITRERVKLWLNEAMVRIADECPGLPDLDFKCVTSTDFSTDKILYPLSDLTCGDTTDEEVAFIYNVWYSGGGSSAQLYFYPLDEFDGMMIDPTSSDYSPGTPLRWTRRGNYIEIAPRPSTDYNNTHMRVDGMHYAREFTVADSTAVCQIKNTDEGLEYYAIAKAWWAIGDEAKSQVNMKKFSNPYATVVGEYGWLERFKDKYSRMDSWDAELYPQE